MKNKRVRAFFNGGLCTSFLLKVFACCEWPGRIMFFRTFALYFTLVILVMMLTCFTHRPRGWWVC